MLKANGTTSDGTPLLVLGLTGENMARLMNGEPISFDASEVGLSAMKVLIMGGKTEEEMAAELRRFGAPSGG